MSQQLPKKRFEQASVARRTVKMVREHSQPVLQALADGKRRLHELSWKEIVPKVSLAIEQQPHFEVVPSRGLMVVHAPTGQPSHAYYEVGHQVFLHRVSSKLVDKGLLPAEHEKLFHTALGPLCYGSTLVLKRLQLAALNKLEREIGGQRTERLLKHAELEWRKGVNELRGYFRERSSAERAAYHLDDLFSHPWLNQFFFAHRKSSPKLSKVSSRSEAMRLQIQLGLERLVKEKQGEIGVRKTA